MFYYAILYW